MHPPPMELTEKEKTLIRRINLKVEHLKAASRTPARLGFRSFYQLLDPAEHTLAEKIANLNPRDFGFKGPYHGIAPIPKNLVAIGNQKYREEGRVKTIAPAPLLPKNVARAYWRLRKMMKKEIEKTLLVESAYRSPAYQLAIFLYYLEFHNWNISKTAKRVALPGYSEHGNPKQQAMDFITADGKPSDEKPLEFARTEEYRWLLENAHCFGFYLSYPKHNRWGVAFEPWHWSYQP